ncbi:hypothetical protein ACH51_17705 (plasmid) [Ralstonia solanacearum]|nr:hypothetical protein ACH51_17705 [Ralstonia solanacearum]
MVPATPRQLGIPPFAGLNVPRQGRVVRHRWLLTVDSHGVVRCQRHATDSDTRGALGAGGRDRRVSRIAMQMWDGAVVLAHPLRDRTEGAVVALLHRPSRGALSD